MSITEIVYIDRDNTNDLLLKADGEAVDLSSATRMVLIERNGVFTIDSDESASAFDWDTSTTGKVLLTLGHEDVAAGAYVCDLIVYDPTNTNGVNWGRLVLKFQ